MKRLPNIAFNDEIVARGFVEAVSLAESPTTTLLIESQLTYEAVQGFPYSLGTTSGWPSFSTATQLLDVPAERRQSAMEDPLHVPLNALTKVYPNRCHR